jgi:general secretion pathway protein A
MYQEHWGLRETPFASGLDPARFYRSPTHDEALARLHFLIDERRRLGLLLGAAGSGKSLLLEVLAQEVARLGAVVVRLNLLAVGQQEFLWQLADGLGLFPCRSEPAHSLWRGITSRLAEHRCQQLQTVVLVDDADEGQPEVLEHLVRFAQHDASSQSLTLVLACAGRRLARLGPRLLGLSDLRIDIVPWEQEDTSQFIVFALSKAGREEPIFDETALRRIHELSSGAPRRVCQLADLCLLAGAAQELVSIDEDTVETVSQELGVPVALA